MFAALNGKVLALLANINTRQSGYSTSLGVSETDSIRVWVRPCPRKRLFEDVPKLIIHWPSRRAWYREPKNRDLCA